MTGLRVRVRSVIVAPVRPPHYVGVYAELEL